MNCDLKMVSGVFSLSVGTKHSLASTKPPNYFKLVVVSLQIQYGFFVFFIQGPHMILVIIKQINSLSSKNNDKPINNHHKLGIGEWVDGKFRFKRNRHVCFC